MIRHILRDNAKAYDKGVLAEILEPIMGKGLIPADPATWKVRRRAIVPGFHKAWLNAMVRGETLQGGWRGVRHVVLVAARDAVGAVSVLHRWPTSVVLLCVLLAGSFLGATG